MEEATCIQVRMSFSCERIKEMYNVGAERGAFRLFVNNPSSEMRSNLCVQKIVEF